MTSYNKKNPTHGQKVTRDPLCKTDIKHEYAGPIASDSLAAESLRSGGHFAEGNPADISSVKGSQSTFAVHDHPGGPHFREVKPGHKLHEDEKIELGRKSDLREGVMTKSVHTGASGSEVQRHEGYEGKESSGKDTAHSTAMENGSHWREDAKGQQKQHQQPGDDASRPEQSTEVLRDPHGRTVPSGQNMSTSRLETPPGSDVPGWSAIGPGGTSGGHGPYPGDAIIEDRAMPRDYNPDKFAPSTSLPCGTVGDPETKKNETPDWDQISKDFPRKTEPLPMAGRRDENPYKAMEPEVSLGTL